MIKVFIDGKKGTTGLKIFERFIARNDVELLTLPDDKRKDSIYRAEMINKSDVTFLCLPDAAAIEAINLVGNDHVKIIDSSTAHRVESGWAYGFPELSQSHREAIKSSNRVAVPGCYASGFTSIVYPLVSASAIKTDIPLYCFGISGYSGGGKKMIIEYEGVRKNIEYTSPREYALSQCHKHLREMQAINGLSVAPLFSPMVCNYYSGMQVTLQFHSSQLNGYKIKDIHEILSEHYKGQKMVNVAKFMDPDDPMANFMPSNTYSGRNDMKIYVCGNDERITISSIFDNLGKGASGAAVQCMNIMMGLDETKGLMGGVNE